MQSQLPPPLCGGYGQINKILKMIRDTEIPTLQEELTKPNFKKLPQVVKDIYRTVVPKSPIAQGGFKIGIWPVPGILQTKATGLCNDLVVKIELSNSPSTKVGCESYWLSESLQVEDSDGKVISYPRLMYYCETLYVEMFLNAICDKLFDQGYMPGLLRTPLQYYIKNYKYSGFGGSTPLILPPPIRQRNHRIDFIEASEYANQPPQRVEEHLQRFTKRGGYPIIIRGRGEDVLCKKFTILVNEVFAMLNAGVGIVYLEKTSPYAAVTLQQRITGDVFDLLKVHMETQNQQYKNVVGISYEFILNYTTQIMWNLSMMQSLLKFRHNDFWFRNCFIQHTPEGVENLIHPSDPGNIINKNGEESKTGGETKTGHVGGPIDLNSYDYHCYEFPSGTTYSKGRKVFMKNTHVQMLISDFGHSRFETKTTVFNNKGWIPDTEDKKKRGFGWGNDLEGAEYVDILTQLSGWIICVFCRDASLRQNGHYNNLLKWENWSIDLVEASTNQYVYRQVYEWLSSVLYLIHLYFFIILGEEVKTDFVPSQANLNSLAKAIIKRTNELYRTTFNHNEAVTNEIKNARMYRALAVTIGELNISKDRKTVSDVFQYVYRLKHNDHNFPVGQNAWPNVFVGPFALFLCGYDLTPTTNKATGKKYIGTTRSMMLRIPEPLDAYIQPKAPFSFGTVLNTFVGQACVNLTKVNGIDPIITTSLPLGKTSYEFSEFKNKQLYQTEYPDSGSPLDRLSQLVNPDTNKQFYNLYKQNDLQITNNPLRMAAYKDIPAMNAVKSRVIGDGIEVYEFKSVFSPLGVEGYNGNELFNGGDYSDNVDNQYLWRSDKTFTGSKQENVPRWVKKSDIHGSPQYINVVRILKGNFDNITPSLYHYKAPKTRAEKNAQDNVSKSSHAALNGRGPKLSLSNILGAITQTQAGVVMSGDYFNYKNHNTDSGTGKHTSDGYCTPPSCNKTIGIVRGSDPHRSAVEEDEKPLSFYEDFFGFVCFKMKNNDTVFDKVSIHSYQSINVNKARDDEGTIKATMKELNKCKLILSGSPVLLQQGEPYFYKSGGDGGQLGRKAATYFPNISKRAKNLQEAVNWINGNYPVFLKYPNSDEGTPAFLCQNENMLNTFIINALRNVKYIIIERLTTDGGSAAVTKMVNQFTARGNKYNTQMSNDQGPLIIGGQGVHFFSPNPRAAIGVDGNGNLLLVTVEGRSQRGIGVDIPQLQKIMKSLDCVSAINEDGGGTSDILYKPKGQLPSIRVNTNPVHKFNMMYRKGPAPGLFPSTALIFKTDDYDDL